MRRGRTRESALGAVAMTAALLSMSNPAMASGQRHMVPVDTARMHPSYEFRILSASSADGRLLVQLVNASTGEAVSGAHVSMLRPKYLGIEAAPMIQNVFVPLNPDGLGTYAYSGERLQEGERLTLRGHVPGDASATWETIVVVD